MARLAQRFEALATALAQPLDYIAEGFVAPLDYQTWDAAFFFNDNGVLRSSFDSFFTLSSLSLGTTNHGNFISEQAARTNALKKDGELTGKEKGVIQKAAAKSDIGK